MAEDRKQRGDVSNSRGDGVFLWESWIVLFFISYQIIKMPKKIKVRTWEQREMYNTVNKLYEKWKSRDAIRRAKRKIQERYHPLEAAFQAINIYIAKQLKRW